MKPFLSVIIPAHNGGKVLYKTVDSLLHQDYSHFEIIAVGDGSNDNTGKNVIECFELCQIVTIDNQCI